MYLRMKFYIAHIYVYIHTRAHTYDMRVCVLRERMYIYKTSFFYQANFNFFTNLSSDI